MGQSVDGNLQKAFTQMLQAGIGTNYGNPVGKNQQNAADGLESEKCANAAHHPQGSRCPGCCNHSGPVLPLPRPCRSR